MRQRELIDYCTDDANRCDGCPYDAECDVYFDMYGTTPACEERNHPERYTDEDIRLIDGGLAIRKQPTIQPVATDTNVGDIISRQQALDIFDDYNVSVEYGELEAYSRDRKRLCELPTVQPERKKGKWIYNSPVTMKCDQCGLVIKDWDWHRFKFCPNCDCDMRGEQE